MDFKQDLINLTKEILDNMGIKYDESDRKILFQFVDRKNRFVDNNISYAIERSHEFTESLKSLSDDQRAGIQQIEWCLKNQKSIADFLSNTLFSPVYKNLDILMKNWNINHAHLSNKKDERKNQSSRLLFFTKENDTIYFIDVIKHPKGHEWFQRRFLEIIDNNWPWLLREVPGVTKLLDPISDTDMQKATSKSFVFYELNNRVIAPTNLGVASDGTSNYAVRKIFHILELLDFWQKEFQENMEKLIGDIKEQNQIEIDKPLQLSLIIEDDLFLAYDEYYQIKIPMFHEP